MVIIVETVHSPSLLLFRPQVEGKIYDGETLFDGIGKHFWAKEFLMMDFFL